MPRRCLNMRQPCLNLKRVSRHPWNTNSKRIRHLDLIERSGTPFAFSKGVGDVPTPKDGIRMVVEHFDSDSLAPAHAPAPASHEEPMPASSTQPVPAPKKRRGFAAMDPKKVSEIASKGGRAAHAAGTAHEFTARAAGRKGGFAAHAKRKSRSDG